MNSTVTIDIHQTLAAWSANFATTLGDSLRAVILFGGLAKGEFVPEQSDVNVMLVLRAVDRAVLDRAAPLIRQGVLEFRLAAMLITEAELRDSADVFPIKFRDIQRHHQVLWGEDPFPKVTIAREQVRLRCEQELRNLSLRLRRGYLQRAERPELLQAALSRALSSLLINLGVLLELKTGKPAENKQDTLANAAQLGIPLEPLRQTWALKCGDLKPDPETLRNLFISFMAAVEQSAELADKLN